jgi:hypothetical protein
MISTKTVDWETLSPEIAFAYLHSCNSNPDWVCEKYIDASAKWESTASLTQSITFWSLLTDYAQEK